MKLKRISPGVYETRDGWHQVERVPISSGGLCWMQARIECAKPVSAAGQGEA